MVKSSTNLVRPRTISQDSPSSLSSLHNHHHSTAQKRQRHSCQELLLCGACMFLFILCACLITILVLVSHSLQSGVLLSHCPKGVAAAATNASSFDTDRSFWYKLLDFTTTKIFSNKHLIQFGGGDPSQRENHKINNNNSSGFDSVQNDSMAYQSKVAEQLSWRLPQEIKPTFYDLFLNPDFDTKHFTGKISIRLNVLQPIPYVVVHAKYLNVTETKLVRRIAGDDSRETSIPIVRTFAVPKYDYWVTELDEPLDIGEYTLRLKFGGNLTGKIVGFYASSYKDIINNETRYIATSKFEPTFARQAFPCFDEPAMKAEFKVSLVRPNSYSALSNMDQIDEEPNPKNKQTTIVHFNTSVPMSTYLACFIVSDFQSKNETVKSNGVGEDVLLRVFATAAQLDKVDFALDTGKKMTEYYIQYFKIGYPLPKLDMIAIPDFVSGAMEHWGLVTFRETSLLYDKATSATSNKQRVAQVVAHELAHMWFGNLVTMKWWNELWLNEGFATYLQYKALDKVFPDWQVLTDFLTDTLHGVLNLDATLAGHPIVQTAETPDQITELFDSITYSKGASVIRMLANYVGEEKFAKAVTNYLNKHKYNNAVTDDLLDEIDGVDNTKDVKRTMATWTKQSGFPVVEVVRQSPTEYILTQKRFFSNPANEANQTVTDSEFHYHWSIPLTYVIDSNPSEVHDKTLFQHEDLKIAIAVPKDTKWIKFNKDQVGYYRVNYELNVWEALSAALSSKIDQFSIADRAHLLNDAFSLAEATQLPYEVPLNLTKYLAKEKYNVPWSVASSKLSSIRKLMSHTENYSKFLQYGRQLIEAPFKSVGWTVKDDLNENKLRVTVLNFACAVGYGPCLKEAGDRFNEWIANPTVRPSPDLRTIVYYYGMLSNGNEQNWEIVWNLFLSETDASEKIKIMNALAAVQNPILLKKFIRLAWDEKNVRGQDYFGCLSNIAANPIGESIVWDYVRENWSQLVGRFTLNERYLGRLIPSITATFTTSTKLDEVNAFFAKYPEAGAGAAARKEALQRIENNIQWLQNNEKNVTKWLNEFVPAPATVDGEF